MTLPWLTKQVHVVTTKFSRAREIVQRGTLCYQAALAFLCYAAVTCNGGANEIGWVHYRDQSPMQSCGNMKTVLHSNRIG
jgi:hypothetical protein